MAKAKKSKGFLSRAASLLGSIPAVGNVRNAAKKVGKAKKTIKRTVKKATKTAKRVVKSTKKNVKKSVKKKKKTAAKLKKGLKKAKKKAKRKVKKKLRKKVGKVFTKARKLKNNLSKSKRVTKLKKQMKKTVLKAKKSVKKTVNKASKTIKKTVAIAKVTSKGMVLAAKDKEAVKQVAITASATLASIVTDFIPVVGNIKSAYEASYGVDPFTREKLDTTDRSLSAASIILGPFGKIVKRGNDGIKFVDKTIDTAKETAAVLEKSKMPPPKKAPVKDIGNVPKGYYQDANGRWHRPDGGYASNKEMGLPEPSGLSKRLEYMGATPGRSSKTGKEVIERMKDETPPRIRTNRNGRTEFMGSDKKWYPLNEADMSHLEDAVSWWNSTGRHYGAKSPEVREWMLNSKNYELDHYSLNRSAGGKLSETYLPPTK